MRLFLRSTRQLFVAAFIAWYCCSVFVTANRRDASSSSSADDDASHVIAAKGLTKDQIKRVVDDILNDDHDDSSSNSDKESSTSSSFSSFIPAIAQGYASKYVGGSTDSAAAGVSAKFVNTDKNGKHSKKTASSASFSAGAGVGGGDFSQYTANLKKFVPDQFVNGMKLAEQQGQEEQKKEEKKSSSERSSSDNSDDDESRSIRKLPSKDQTNPLTNSGFTSSRHAAGVKESPYEYDASKEHSKGKKDPKASSDEIEKYMTKGKKHPDDDDDDDGNDRDSKHPKSQSFAERLSTSDNDNAAAANNDDDDEKNNEAKWKNLVGQYKQLVNEYMQAYKHAYDKGKADATTQANANKDEAKQEAKPGNDEALNVGQNIHDSAKQYTNEHGLPFIGKGKGKGKEEEEEKGETQADEPPVSTNNLNERSDSSTNPSGGFDYDSYLPHDDASSPFIKKYGNVGGNFKHEQDEYAKLFTQGQKQFGSEWSSKFRGGAGAKSSSHSSVPAHGSDKEEDGASSVEPSPYSKPSSSSASSSSSRHPPARSVAHGKNDDSDYSKLDSDYSTFFGGKGKEEGSSYSNKGKGNSHTLADASVATAAAAEETTNSSASDSGAGFVMSVIALAALVGVVGVVVARQKSRSSYLPL